MTISPKLSPRLRAAAELVRPNAFVSDVGTDHAYLPIALCLEGKIRGGVVSDINQGPIDRAKDNIYMYGLSDRLSAVRTDGLSGIERFSPEDIFILGMGGELIASIIAAAPWTKQRGVRLCLQPMTHPELLRAFLLENGYAIIEERLAEEEKIYQIIWAEFCGAAERYSDAELLLGRLNIERGGEVIRRLAEHNVAILRRKIQGKALAGADCSAELKLMEEIKEVIL